MNTKTKSYSRTRIPPGIKIPWGQVDLKYTDHARSRMTEMRTPGSLNILPHMILISDKNLKQIWTVGEGTEERLQSMKVDVPYTRGVLLQLIISADLVVITLYFRKVWQKTPVSDAENPALKSSVCVASPEVPSDQDLLDKFLPMAKATLFQSMELPKIAS